MAKLTTYSGKKSWGGLRRYKIRHIGGKKSLGGKRVSVVGIVGQEKTPDGRDRWRVSTGKEIVNLTTSASSTATMREATIIYHDALKRLADR
jgi:hypothetical protein